MRNYLPLLALAAIALLTQSASAEKLSPEQALSRVSTSNKISSRLHSQKNALHLSKTINTPSANEEAVYIFENSDNNSFLILAADDLFPAVLAYGDNSVANTNGEMAPALSWWLSQYAAQIEYIRELSLTQDVSSLLRSENTSSDREAINPLLSCQWDQKDPYNQLCPTITTTTTNSGGGPGGNGGGPGGNGGGPGGGWGGSTTTTVTTPTGCVATALAQVMYYHKYPASATGTSYYTCDSDTTVVDLSTFTFDWDNMRDSYEEDSSTKSKSAVANLMLACGAAVNAKYAESTTNSKTIKDVTALGEYFGYSSDMRYYYRDFGNFTSEEWEDLVYGSLSRQRPVLYGGGNEETGAGHSFVCDGYYGDGLFHFNWGWSGDGDGYYTLLGLYPETESSETGENGKDYNSRQLIITDVHPAEEGEIFQYQSPAFMGYQGDLTYDEGAFKTNASSTGFYNKAPQTATFDVGVLAVDADDVEHIVIKYYNAEKKCGSGYKQLTISASDMIDEDTEELLPDGNYTVYMIYRVAGDTSEADTRADSEASTSQMQYMAYDNNTDGYVDIHILEGAILLGHNSIFESTSDIKDNLADNEKLKLKVVDGGDAIKVYGVSGNAEINVYTIAGEQMMSKVTTAENAVVDLSTLPSGVYLVTATTSDSTATLKLIR